MPWYLKIESTRLLRSLRGALHTLRPVLIVAALAQAFHLSVVAPNGFFAQIYHVNWPRWTAVLLSNVTTVLWGSLALMVVVLMVIDLGHHHQTACAIAAMAMMVLLTADPTRNLSWPHLGPSALLLAVVVAPLMAGLFDRVKTANQASIAIFGVVVLALGLGLGTRLAASHLSWAWLDLPDGLLVPLNLLLIWLGVPQLLSPLTDFAMSPTAAANLNAALAHPSLTTVPFRYTAYTLFEPFGNMGGSGSVLALVIALAIANHRVAIPELLTSAVNLPMLTVLTTPVVLDLRLLIPFLLAPLASSGIAAGALALHLMPPVVYSVPPSTPGPLMAFLGTNGNWPALIVSLLCLAVSVAIYYPFVKLVAKGVPADAQMAA